MDFSKKLSDYCMKCLDNPCKCTLNLHMINERILKYLNNTTKLEFNKVETPNIINRV